MSPDTRTACATSAITVDCTVNAAIATSPAATAILNAHNIDTCCGGRASIGEAVALTHGDPFALIADLTQAARDVAPTMEGTLLPVTSCSCGCR